MRRLGALVLLLGAGCTDLFGLERVPEPPPVKTPDPGGRVAAGYLHTCSLHDDGQLANGAAWRVAPVQAR